MGDLHFRGRAWEGEGAAREFLHRTDTFSFTQEKDRIDRVRIVDVIGRDAGRVGSARRLGEKHLVEEPALGDVRAEYFPFADVLVADGGSEIFPRWILRVGRGTSRMRGDVTGSA